MTDTELRRRIVALELAVDRLTVELSELKARPQPATTIGGAGNHWPFAPNPDAPRWVEQNGRLRFVTGDNVSRETPKGPVGSAENPLIVKDR